MSARRRASHPSAVLLAAVEGGDVYKVRELLDRGVDPLLSYKNTCAAEAAMNSGNEEMIRPFVEAFRRDPCASNLRNLHITTCRLFADDRFSASFAAEHAHDLRIELTGVREQGGDMHGVWGSLLLHGEINFSEYKPGRRDPGTLAAKVRVAIELGWDPANSWVSGWLPHHAYLNQGFIEAALVCIEAGADPEAPLYDFGNRSPEQFGAWPAFQAALRVRRANEVPTSFPSTRMRQRA